MTKMFVVLSRVEKYRPKTLDDLISHKDIISTSMKIDLSQRNICN